ncbi:hypothetical protein [Natranaerobius trueperi]|uniref:hypothetical protein n=1 Tax=Natranaerobius trueperi TaxID=759412 RepID=UPI003B83A154
MLKVLPNLFKGCHTNLREVSVIKTKEHYIDSKEENITLHADGEIIGTLPANLNILS